MDSLAAFSQHLRVSCDKVREVGAGDVSLDDLANWLYTLLSLAESQCQNDTEPACPGWDGARAILHEICCASQTGLSKDPLFQNFWMGILVCQVQTIHFSA